jgi:hypothetical protein
MSGDGFRGNRIRVLGRFDRRRNIDAQFKDIADAVNMYACTVEKRTRGLHVVRILPVAIEPVVGINGRNFIDHDALDPAGIHPDVRKLKTALRQRQVG